MTRRQPKGLRTRRAGYSRSAEREARWAETGPACQRARTLPRRATPCSGSCFRSSLRSHIDVGANPIGTPDGSHRCPRADPTPISPNKPNKKDSPTARRSELEQPYPCGTPPADPLGRALAYEEPYAGVAADRHALCARHRLQPVRLAISAGKWLDTSTALPSGANVPSTRRYFER